MYHPNRTTADLETAKVARVRHRGKINWQCPLGVGVQVVEENLRDSDTRSESAFVVGWSIDVSEKRSSGAQLDLGVVCFLLGLESRCLPLSQSLGDLLPAGCSVRALDEFVVEMQNERVELEVGRA
jgi:hypothetical protein